MVKAIIFDLDGVLVDAVEWHYRALNRALSLFGYPIAPAEHAAVYDGMPTAAKLEILSQRRGFPRALHGFVNEMKQLYTREIVKAELGPDSRVTGLLDELRGRGFRLAVASNSIRTTVELFLAGMGIRDRFDVVLSHEDVARPKPDPQIYRRAIELMGVSASECLIVEDSVPGVQAARQVTANVLVVAGPREVTLERILPMAEREPSAKLLPGCLEIVIPMAGLGTRFAAKGYDKPKPLIEIFGKPMIQWVVENVRPRHQDHRFTFLVHEAHLKAHAVDRLLGELAPGCSIVPVPATTEGAACTALLALDRLDLERPLLIANSDQWVELDIDHFLYAASLGNDGLILTFPASDPKWSYARMDASGRVVEVAEKKPISPHATVGIYHFRRGQDFADAARAMIRANHRVNGEFYVCPVYNELIARGATIRCFPLAAGAMHGLGVPEDLEAFVQWHLTLAVQHKSLVSEGNRLSHFPIA